MTKPTKAATIKPTTPAQAKRKNPATTVATMPIVMEAKTPPEIGRRRATGEGRGQEETTCASHSRASSRKAQARGQSGAAALLRGGCGLLYC